MAGWLHGVFMSVCWFVRPRCGLSLSRCRNYTLTQSLRNGGQTMPPTPTHSPQLQHRHSCYLCPPSRPHHDINSGTANPASKCMPHSCELTGPLRWYISAFPLCTKANSSCIARHTNAPLAMHGNVPTLSSSATKAPPRCQCTGTRMYPLQTAHTGTQHDVAHPSGTAYALAIQ